MVRSLHSCTETPEGIKGSLSFSRYLQGERLCARHDYRQMLFVSRLCVGLPVFRRDEPNLNPTNLRCQAADRWVLKRGARSLNKDYMRIDESSFSIGDPPESLYRDTIKLHKLVEFHQLTILELMRFNCNRSRP